MAVDETGDESCHVWLAPFPGSLEGFQIDFLQCFGASIGGDAGDS
jgi:hypothetical protein